MITIRVLKILLFLSYCSAIVYSQPKELWTKYYDGGSIDIARHMEKDKEGNYIVTGASVVSDPGYSNYGVVTIKYDSSGNQIWVKSIDNPSNATDDASVLLVDDSNNVYVAGIFGINYFLVKYDENGNEEWLKQFNSYFTDFNSLDKHVCLDDLGNIYYATVILNNGQKHSALRKYSPQGELLWLKEFNNISRTEDEPVSVTYDGEKYFYLTGGAVISDSNINYYVLKFDKNGDMIWEKDYGTDSSSSNRPAKLRFGNNSDLYIVGTRFTLHNFYDINVIKIDTSGNRIWEKNINGNSNRDDLPYDMILDSEQYIYITGSTTTFVPPSNLPIEFYTVKLDNNGNIIWTHILEDSLDEHGCGLELGLDSNNNLYVTGVLSTSPNYIQYHMEVVKYASQGNLKWSFNKIFGAEDWPAEMIVNSEDDFTIFLTSAATGSDYITTKYSNNVVGVMEGENTEQFKLLQNYPNPFNPLTTISYSIPATSNVNVKVYDILGNEIATLVDMVQKAGEYNIEFNCFNLSSGIYFYKVIAGIHSQTKKMVLLK